MGIKVLVLRSSLFCGRELKFISSAGRRFFAPKIENLQSQINEDLNFIGFRVEEGSWRQKAVSDHRRKVARLIVSGLNPRHREACRTSLNAPIHETPRHLAHNLMSATPAWER
jgi:hypothetical protein